MGAYPHNPKVAGSNPAPATRKKAPETNSFRGLRFSGAGAVIRRPSGNPAADLESTPREDSRALRGGATARLTSEGAPGRLQQLRGDVDAGPPLHRRAGFACPGAVGVPRLL